MNIIALSEERDEEASYGYCDDYKPHAVRRIYDDAGSRHYDLRWDKAGNLGQISLAGKEALFKSGRFLFWTEDNRLHTAVDEKHYSYYVYDHSGERRVKLTGESEWLDANADLMLTGSLLYKPTLYPSPYLVLSMNEYTKHYYAGAERVAACLGGGGLDIVTHGANHSSGTDPTGTSASTGGSYIGPGYEPHQPEASEEEELKKIASQLQDTANNLFNQSYHQLANRKLDQNDPDCLWNVDVYQDELRRPFVGIPDGMEAKVGIDLEKFRTSVIEQRKQHHDESEYVYYYHSDHLGSASWITDHDGNPVQHLQYLPYGEPFVDQHPAGYQERFRFTGKERDEETGYGYFGARYMDHELMTIWLSVDRYASKYPSISPYAYCAWNPVRLIDPNGMEAMEGWPPQRFKEKWNKLNRQEQNVLLYDIRFMKALTMDKNSGLAVAETKKQYGRNGKGDESDAFRHAYWQALNTQDVGEDFTRKMSDAHEYSTPAKEVDSDLIMDIHNNDLGIQVGRENPQASPAELISIIKSKMDAGELLIINKDGKLVKSNGKPLAESEIRRLSKSHEIKNDILLHRKTKVEGSKYE